MELVVKCNVCSKVILIVEKPIIFQDDIDMYSSNCLCDEHLEDAVITETVEE